MMSPLRMMSRAGALAFSLFVLTSACESTPAPAPEAPAAGDWHDRLVFAPAERPEAAAVISLPGEVVLPPCAVREIAPPLAGRLDRWYVRSGMEVAEGTTLADLVSTELADLDATEKELKRIVRDRRRVMRAQREHVKAGMQSVQSVYEAELALTEVEARLAAVRRQLEAREQLGADRKQGDMTWQWTAPVAGVVRALSCAAGSMAGPEKRCLTILDTSKAEVGVAVPERFLPQVVDEVHLRWLPAWRRDPALALDMTLTRRDPLVDPRSRTQLHYFRPTEPEAAGWENALVVGSTGRATLLTPPAPDLLRVPPLSIVRLGGKDVVFAAGADGADPTPVPVAVVGRFEGHPLVRSEALKVGDSVVARGAFLLKSIRLLASE